MSALFSDDRVYRYALSREWIGEGKGRCLFVMLNPSTADEWEDDPTIRRCIRFAGRWGYDALDVGNLFAFRATSPERMLEAEDPVGPENDRILLALAEEASLIVVAWGVHGKYRDREVLTLLFQAGHPVVALAVTQGGFPMHPLYQPRDATPERYYGRSSNDVAA